MRDQIASIHWIIEKAREFQKNICFCFIDYPKAFDCVNHNKLENSESDGNTRPPDLPLEKPEEPLQIAVKRREVKSKGKKRKIYPFEYRVPKNSKKR